MGRINYEGFASYWPFQEGEFADAMNKTPKYVATRNRELTEVQWGNYGDTISLLAGDLLQRAAELKNEIEGNIIVPGSAGLVDEISMIIHPVILGSNVESNGKRSKTVHSTT
jgi:dihydrofolate reductase